LRRRGRSTALYSADLVAHQRDGIASLGHGGVCGPKLPTLVLELDENIRDLTERQAVSVAQKIIYKQADLLYKSEKMKK
jgi:hypothetical protein